jgi:hypothetical protein
MSLPWSSELAAELRRDREELITAFLILRGRLRHRRAEEFVGGEDERSRLLQDTEHDAELSRRPRMQVCPIGFALSEALLLDAWRGSLGGVAALASKRSPGRPQPLRLAGEAPLAQL